MRLRTGILATETSAGTVLLDERTGDYWQLNETATSVLRTLAADGTVQDAARRIAEEFDVELSRSLSDVIELVDGLRAAGLIAP